MRLTDDHLFEYPWIYATQTGWWGLTDAETARLREYLLRGGFLVVDDFWGPEQWEVFRQTMNRVFPGQPITDIAESDSVMHVLYDIREKDFTFIPGSRHLRRGPGGAVQIVQPEGTKPAWRAIYDDRNRMVVAVNFNTDVADAWEFADVPYYPEAMTSLAYRLRDQLRDLFDDTLDRRRGILDSIPISSRPTSPFDVKCEPWTSAFRQHPAGNCGSKCISVLPPYPDGVVAVPKTHHQVRHSSPVAWDCGLRD